MNKEHSDLILSQLATILEVEANELTFDYQLDTNGLWDSLAIINIITMIDMNFDIVLNPDHIATCTTVEELLTFISQKVNHVCAN